MGRAKVQLWSNETCMSEHRYSDWLASTLWRPAEWHRWGGYDVCIAPSLNWVTLCQRAHTDAQNTAGAPGEKRNQLSCLWFLREISGERALPVKMYFLRWASTNRPAHDETEWNISDWLETSKKSSGFDCDKDAQTGSTLPEERVRRKKWKKKLMEDGEVTGQERQHGFRMVENWMGTATFYACRQLEGVQRWQR